MRTLPLIAALLVLAGCGRYFPGPLRPTSQQAPQMSVNDDGSVTVVLPTPEKSRPKRVGSPSPPRRTNWNAALPSPFKGEGV